MDALHEVAKVLETSLGEAESAKLAWKPQVLVEVDEANAATLLKMIDALEDDDDVQTVWGNYDVSDEVMAKLGMTRFSNPFPSERRRGTGVGL